MAEHTAAEAVTDLQRQGAAAAMIAHGLAVDVDALRDLARIQPDPVEFAVSVALAAREVLAMTSLQVNEAPLFDLEDAHRWALVTARRHHDDAAYYTAHPGEWGKVDDVDGEA